MWFRFFHIIVISLLMFLAAVRADAKPVIADMSDYRISITSDFTGKRLLLFGARNDFGDILVVVRGPKRSITIRKKEQFGGVWLNGQKVTFQDVPYYYAVAGSRPLAEMNISPAFKALQLGIPYIEFDTAQPVGRVRKQEFRDAFIEYQKAKRLYQDYARPLTFMASTLFKTVIQFPDTLPRGNYAVDIYLIADGVIQAMQTLPIEVKKVGFDAFVYDAAHQHEWLYGLFAVAIALGFGWLVSYLFTKVW